MLTNCSAASIPHALRFAGPPDIRHHGVDVAATGKISRRVILAGSTLFSTATILRASGPSISPQAAEAALVEARRIGGKSRWTMALAAMSEERLLLAANEQILAETLAKPGSVVKPFVLWRLMQTATVRPESEFFCRGKFRHNGRILDCSHAPQPGPLRAEEALALSCNEYFFHFGLYLKPREIPDLLLRLGADSRSPFGKRVAAGKLHQLGGFDEGAVQALGEAGIVVNPLALLSAFRRMLLEALALPDSDTSRTLFAGMKGCVHYGTGVDGAVPGLSIAGKTGTGTSPERQRLDGWFLSYAPAAKPRYVMVVFIENGRGGSEAAPISAAAWRALKKHGAFA